METLFKVEINQDRKMWYEDFFNTLQKKQFKIYHLVCACFAAIYIIIMITVRIKQKQIALTGSGIFAVVGLMYAITYDYVIAFFHSLIQQRRIRKNTGLPYIPTIKIFYEDNMEWSNPKGKGVVSYNEITEVQTTKNMIILVNPKEKCRYFVSKKGFIMGTPHDFEQFITSKITH